MQNFFSWLSARRQNRGCEFEPHSSHPIHSSERQAWRAISINQKGGCRGRMLCERLPCPNGGIKRTRTKPSTQDPH